ncbi:MAG: hypothetical protein JTJ30_12750 [Catenibacterium mitsuokai]|nr:hypothetical protein [Catenibacterium mitsuokai]MBN2932835.1 hypothetical protein [Catenibacterium mitsuokai]
MTNKKQNTQVIDIKTALANAKKLQEGEKLELVDKLYTCDVDETTGEITVTIKANLADVVRSAKGSNFIVPLANTKGVRGGGVITATSEKGVSCKIYADRLYLSTVEIEKEKEQKTVKTSKTAQLEADMQALLKKNAEAEARAERLEAMMAELLASKK